MKIMPAGSARTPTLLPFPASASLSAVHGYGCVDYSVRSRGAISVASATRHRLAAEAAAFIQPAFDIHVVWCLRCLAPSHQIDRPLNRVRPFD